jgi:phosphate starvation-inducible PhoH-like protein
VPTSDSQASTQAGTRRLQLPDENLDVLFGTGDEQLRRVERVLGVTLTARGGELRISGPAERTELAERLFAQLGELLEAGHPVDKHDIETGAKVLLEAPETSLREFFSGGDLLTSVRRLVTPRGLRQQLYLKLMTDHDIVMAIGPAGTGKTFLAVAMAMAYLQEKLVRRIILARPAVEAGEKLGFLPGDLAEKVNPYLRPLFDALYDLIGFERAARMMDRGIIEVAPVAFMRGRTLNDSFIILDEAQNTTSEQMKMFLTRIGFNSKAVVTGDVTQVDLPAGKVSGLREAERILRHIQGIGFIHFDERDVVRHRLVQKIVSAYESWEARPASKEAAADPAPTTESPKPPPSSGGRTK